MKGKIKIDSELCKGCGFCVITCPKGIIKLGTTFNNLGYLPAMVIDVDMEKCTGCMLCAEICPEIAIEVWQEIE
ncbi:MAG: ferredoxin family protein [Candidatus Magnetoovum sp. WYHC-5]|nr:ferredoxin family protein [Candidatus Magnetoovum sp. WYHC-5]